MNLPFFYIAHIDTGSQELVLEEDSSRHAVGVLRMKEGQLLNLTDGRGMLLTAAITDPHKKKCRVTITGMHHKLPPAIKTGIGISLVKNPVRFEWFLEKAAEIGVTEIFPLLCSRTEKQHSRYDRMKNVLVSALLQSRQTWLPVLHEPVKFEWLVTQQLYAQKFIAHCREEEKKTFNQVIMNPSASQLILIGPEGDFTPDEITRAQQLDFMAVSLGSTRLRTETAGVVAAVLLKNAY